VPQTHTPPNLVNPEMSHTFNLGQLYLMFDDLLSVFVRNEGCLLTAEDLAQNGVGSIAILFIFVA
jgi:hypothetical protein